MEEDRMSYKAHCEKVSNKVSHNLMSYLRDDSPVTRVFMVIFRSPFNSIIFFRQHGCNRVQSRGGPQIGICNGVQKSLEIIGSTPQAHTCPECWQLWPTVGGASNGAAEEDWCWDLNPGEAAIWHLFLGPRIFWGTMWLGLESGPWGFAPFLPHG